MDPKTSDRTRRVRLVQVESVAFDGWDVTSIDVFAVTPACISASVSGTSKLLVYVVPPFDALPVQNSPALHPRWLAVAVPPVTVNSDMAGAKFSVVS